MYTIIFDPHIDYNYDKSSICLYLIWFFTWNRSYCEVNASETRRLRHKSPGDLHCVTFGWAFMAVKTWAKRLNYGRNHLPTKLPYNSNIYICVVLFTFKVFENCVAYNNNNNEGGAPQFYWCNFCGFCIILELFVTWIISAMDDEILLQFTVKIFSHRWCRQFGDLNFFLSLIEKK